MPEVDPSVGTVLDGRYRILARLGEGDMSVVYKAEHQSMKRLVAIKMLHASLENEGTSQQRFQQEAKTLGMLDHPHILAVHDFGVTEDGHPYLVMNFLEGKSLDQVIEAEGKVAPLRAVGIFLQICEALAHAHGMGIIHRDLKPSNIMLLRGEDGSDLVKIVDFGIAKFAPGSENRSLKLTKTGLPVGSPQYMSPEQWNNQEADARSDIYSLGSVMYETLTGRSPLRDEQLREFMFQDNTKLEPLPFSAANDLISDELERALLKTLRKDKTARHASALELKQELEQTPEWKAISPEQILLYKKRGRQRKMLHTALKCAVAATILITAASAGLLWYGTTTPGEIVLRKLYQQFQERIVPPMDRRLLPNMSKLADLYVQANDYPDATELYERMLLIAMNEYRTDSFELADLYYRLAQCYLHQKVTSKQAQEICGTALTLFSKCAQKQFADGHPEKGEEYFNIAYGLASSYSGSMKKRAMAQLLQPWASCEKDTGDRLKDFGFWSRAAGHYQQALELWMGKELPDLRSLGMTVEGATSLARGLFGHGDVAQAEALDRSTLAAQAEELNGSWEYARDHSPEFSHNLSVGVAQNLYHLSCVLKAEGKTQEAEKLCKKAVSMLKVMGRSDDPEVAQLLLQLGECRLIQGLTSKGDLAHGKSDRSVEH